MTRTEKSLRAGLAALAVVEVGAGAWQSFLPMSFFDFPWVENLPPYNEHFITDIGGMNLAMAVVLAGAARSLDRGQVDVALTAFLVYAGTHFLFHASHLAGLTSIDAIGQTIVLALGVIAPVALLVVNRRTGPKFRESRRDGQGSSTTDAQSNPTRSHPRA